MLNANSCNIFHLRKNELNVNVSKSIFEAFTFHNLFHTSINVINGEFTPFQLKKNVLYVFVLKMSLKRTMYNSIRKAAFNIIHLQFSVPSGTTWFPI